MKGDLLGPVLPSDSRSGDLRKVATGVTAIAFASVASAILLVTLQLLFGQPLTAETLDILRLDILVFGIFDSACIAFRRRRFVLIPMAVVLGVLISGYQTAYTGTLLGTMRLLAFLIAWPFLNLTLMSAVIEFDRRRRTN